MLTIALTFAIFSILLSTAIFSYQKAHNRVRFNRQYKFLHYQLTHFHFPLIPDGFHSLRELAIIHVIYLNAINDKIHKLYLLDPSPLLSRKITDLEDLFTLVNKRWLPNTDPLHYDPEIDPIS